MSDEQNGIRPLRNKPEEELKRNWGERLVREEAHRNRDYSGKYDLEERMARFGESVIDFAKTLPGNVINRELIGQLVRAGTSVGANYNEADGAESKKDFRHKIAICKKESKESRHWLRMIARANSERAGECQSLWREAHELTLIFSSILTPKKIW